MTGRGSRRSGELVRKEDASAGTSPHRTSRPSRDPARIPRLHSHCRLPGRPPRQPPALTTTKQAAEQIALETQRGPAVAAVATLPELTVGEAGVQAPVAREKRIRPGSGSDSPPARVALGHTCVVGVPATRYAKSGDVHIAYRLFGSGPCDLVLVPGLTSNLDAEFRAPGEVDEMEAIGKIARCVTFDKRGTGISDRVQGAPSLEERMDDVRAVMDAISSAEAVIFGRADGGAMSILFAATYPKRTVGLVLQNPQVRFTRAPDFPWGRLARSMTARQSVKCDCGALVSRRLRSHGARASPTTTRRWKPSRAVCGSQPAPERPLPSGR